MNIIFDLDGTLIDSRKRLYILFNDLVPQSKLTFADYWAAKRSGRSNIDLLKINFDYSDERLDKFQCMWMFQIETQKYLEFDHVFEGVEMMLDSVSKTAQLYVCTARQNRELATRQLESLGLAKYFERVMVTEHLKTKEALIIENVGNLSGSDWVVGDTGHDINVGKLLGLKTCAVTDGFMSKKLLERYSPDFVIANVANFAVLLEDR